MNPKKISALTLSFLIVTTYIGMPISQAYALGEENAFIGALTPSARFGEIVDSYQAPQQKGLVVYIEDLHFNRSVQRNIIQLLKFYNRLYPTAPIGVEGAAGPLDYSSLSSHYPVSGVKNLVDYLIENGEINGPEGYVLLTQQLKRLAGIENPKYYSYHRRLFKDSYAERMELHRSLLSLLKQLQTLHETLGHSRENNDLQNRIAEAREPLKGLEALLAERLTQDETMDVARRLPQTLALLESLEPTLPHPLMLNQDDLQDAVQASLDYYAAALLRDQPLAENTLQLLQDQKVAFVITGGFHERGVTQAFKQAGVSYVVVMPEIKEQTPKDDALYIRRLLGGHVGDQREDLYSVDRDNTLGVSGDILASANGAAVIDDYYRQPSQTGFFSSFLELFGWGGSSHEEPPAPRPEPEISSRWSSSILGSESWLYRYTIASIQQRIDSYREKHNIQLFQTSDLAANVTYLDPSGKIRSGPVVSEASSDVLDAGLDASKDLKVSEPDITFKPQDITDKETFQTVRAVLWGEVLHQYVMAGEASRMKKSIREKGIPVTDDELQAAYFLDIGFLNGDNERKSMWGTRQFLQLRYQIEQLAEKYGPELGLTPREAVRNQRIIIHTNAKTDARIALDWQRHDFYGFNPEHVVFIPQYVDKPLELVDGQVRPVHQNVDPVAFGNGWPMLEAVMPGVAYRVLARKRVPLEEDALKFFEDQTVRYVHQYRVNDLYNITADSLDIPYLAREIRAISEGSKFVVRMVSNPKGTKGGISLLVTQAGWQGARFLLADTLAANDLRTKYFLDTLQTAAPYHRFANTYDLTAMRNALRTYGLKPDFELKTFKDGEGHDVQLINPQYVTGMLTAIGELNAVTIYKDGEPIQDFKDLPNPEALAYWRAQTEQPGFSNPRQNNLNIYLHPYTDLNDDVVTYRPWQVFLSFLAPLALLTWPVVLAIHGHPLLSTGIFFPTIVGMWSFGVGLSKEIYVISQLLKENLGIGVFLKALARSAPVEEYNRKTGEVAGLTGVVPIAHTARSHAIFGNELGAHGLDLVTIPFAMIQSLMIWLTLHFSPRLLVNREELMNSPLVVALKSVRLAALLPSGAHVNKSGVIQFPVVPSSFATKLQRVLGFDTKEKEFLQRTRGVIASQA